MGVMGKQALTIAALCVIAGAGLTGCGSGARLGSGAIAYTGPGGQAYVVSTFGARAHPIGSGAAVAISPDGRTVAVIRGGRKPSESGVFLVNTATGASTLLTHHLGLTVRWAPDSSRLLFEQVDPHATGYSEQLLLCTRLTGRCRVIVGGDLNGYAFSPDGRSIAYGNPVSTGTSTGDVVILAPHGTRQILGAYDTVSLWAPAGLIVSETPNGQTQTVALSSNDGTIRRLFSARPGVPYLDPVDVSPDGSTVLYESLVTCGSNDPSAVPLACLATGVVIETGSINGGTPSPASTHLSQSGTARFASNGSVIAAFSTATANDPPNAYDSAPLYLGEQRLAPAGTTPPPPTLTADRIGGLALPPATQ